MCYSKAFFYLPIWLQIKRLGGGQRGGGTVNCSPIDNSIITLWQMAGLECWNWWGKGGFRCRWGCVKRVGDDQERKYLLLCLQAPSVQAVWHETCVRFKVEAELSRELLSWASARVKKQKAAGYRHPWWNHRLKFIHSEKWGGYKTSLFTNVKLSNKSDDV